MSKREKSPARPASNEVQQKTYTRWVNAVLAQREIQIESIFTGFADGTALCHLLELLSGKKIQYWRKAPRNHAQKLDNISMSLDFMIGIGMRLINISAQNIFEGTPTCMMGLMWTMIRHFQVSTSNSTESKSDTSSDNGLLDFIQKQLEPYGVPPITSLTTCWTDGSTLRCLVDSISLCPNFDYLSILGAEFQQYSEAGSGEEDIYMAWTEQAMEQALQDNSIPRLIDAEDLLKRPDSHSIMTYLSYFAPALQVTIDRRNAPSVPVSPPEEDSIPPEPISQNALDDVKQLMEVKSTENAALLAKLEATVAELREKEQALRDRESSSKSELADRIRDLQDRERAVFEREEIVTTQEKQLANQEADIRVSKASLSAQLAEVEILRATVVPQCENCTNAKQLESESVPSDIKTSDSYSGPVQSQSDALNISHAVLVQSLQEQVQVQKEEIERLNDALKELYVSMRGVSSPKSRQQNSPHSVVVSPASPRAPRFTLRSTDTDSPNSGPAPVPMPPVQDHEEIFTQIAQPPPEDDNDTVHDLPAPTPHAPLMSRKDRANSIPLPAPDDSRETNEMEFLRSEIARLNRLTNDLKTQAKEAKEQVKVVRTEMAAEAKKEFFFLTCMAVKMNHELKNQVLGVDPNILFAKSRDQKIEFFDLHKWLAEELTRSIQLDGSVILRSAEMRYKKSGILQDWADVELVVSSTSVIIYLRDNGQGRCLTAIESIPLAYISQFVHVAKMEGCRFDILLDDGRVIKFLCDDNKSALAWREFWDDTARIIAAKEKLKLEETRKSRESIVKPSTREPATGGVQPKAAAKAGDTPAKKKSWF